MALLKNKELLTGQHVEYWTIGRPDVVWRPDAKIHAVNMYAWVNKAAKDTGKSIVGEACVVVHVDLPIGESINVADIYAAIKEPKPDEDGNETNWFADAEDV